MKPSAPAPVLPKPPEARLVALADLVESKHNPRRTYDPLRMEELVASVRKFGVIQPLLGRLILPAGKKVEVICGTRRLRAAKTAGLPNVPVQVGSYSDLDVLELQLVENIQREDVNPYEEAEGFDRLIKLGRYTVASVAEKINRDATYVYRRMGLLKLIPELRDIFLANRISADHARVLCGLQPADQALVLKERLWEPDQRDGGDGKTKGHFVKTGHPTSVRDLSDWIRRNVLLVLQNAPWDLTDPTLVAAAGSCQACPKRTGANLALFEDLHDKADRCLDRACFESKVAAFLKREGDGCVRIATAWGQDSEFKKRGVKLPVGRYVPVIPGKECQFAEKAIVAMGNDLGKHITICRSPKCKTHARRSTASPSRSPADSWAAKEARLPGEIDLAFHQELARQVLAKATPRIVAGQDLRAVVLALVYSGDSEEIAAALGLPKAKPGKFRQLESKIHKAIMAVPHAKLPKLALEFAIATEPGFAEPGETTPIELLAKARSIDVRALRAATEKKLRAEFAREKEAALKPKPKPAAKKKPGAKK